MRVKNTTADTRQSRFGRTRKPFDDVSAAHAVVKAMEECGYSVDDPDSFIRRVKNTEYGLSSEVEFATLLRWLGACPFVHRLDRESFADSTEATWAVPDLLAVFRSDQGGCSAAIEVKTTKGRTLRFRPDYLARLKAYADLIAQPLLLAWRPRDVGFWILVDPIHLHSTGDLDGKLEFEVAIKHDLMSVLAGDYYVVPRKGVGLVLKARRVSGKRETGDGYEAVFRIDDARFQNADGDTVRNLPDAIIWTILATAEERQNVTDDGFTQSFVASGSTTRAQYILRTAATFRLGENQRINWKAIGSNFDSFVTNEELSLQINNHFGSFIRYVFHQQPQKVPCFLPKDWHLAASRTRRQP